MKPEEEVEIHIGILGRCDDTYAIYKKREEENPFKEFLVDDEESVGSSDNK